MKMLPLIIVVLSDSANNEQTLEGFVMQILSQYIAQSHGSDVMIRLLTMCSRYCLNYPGVEL